MSWLALSKGFQLELQTGEVSRFNYPVKLSLRASHKERPPVGDYKPGLVPISKEQQLSFEYQHGAGPTGQEVSLRQCQNIIEKCPMSLWNLAPRSHTGRITSIFRYVLYLFR